jgi:hypothetical protein
VHKKRQLSIHCTQNLGAGYFVCCLFLIRGSSYIKYVTQTLEIQKRLSNANHSALPLSISYFQRDLTTPRALKTAFKKGHPKITNPLFQRIFQPDQQIFKIKLFLLTRRRSTLSHKSFQSLDTLDLGGNFSRSQNSWFSVEKQPESLLKESRQRPFGWTRGEKLATTQIACDLADLGRRIGPPSIQGIWNLNIPAKRPIIRTQIESLERPRKRFYYGNGTRKLLS